MTDVTVKQFATVVGIPVDRLLEQFTEAGITVAGADSTITPIFAGGLLAWCTERTLARVFPDGVPEHARQRGLLFAAGLIAGEALIGVLIAVPIVVSGDPDVLALGSGIASGGWVATVALAVMAAWMYRSAIRGDDSSMTGEVSPRSRPCRRPDGGM